jgi:hypothetical protein
VRGFYLHLNIPNGTPADVEKYYKQALTHGATSLTEPRQEPWGGFHASVRDPSGFDWGFCSWPPAPPQAEASGTTGGGEEEAAKVEKGAMRGARHERSCEEA